MELKNRKISIVIILGSLLLLLYTFLGVNRVKTYNGHYTNLVREEDISLFEVKFLFFTADYLSSLFVLITMLGIGIYLVLFKEDKDISSGFISYHKKSAKRFSHLITKISKAFKNISKPSVSQTQSSKVKSLFMDTNFTNSNTGTLQGFNEEIVEDKGKTKLKYFLWFMLVWSFVVSISAGFYLPLVIPLAYYLSVVYSPKTKREFFETSIAYPLIIFVGVAYLGSLIQSSLHPTENEISSHIGNQLSYMVLPLIICGSIVYVRTKNQLKSNLEYTVNWVLIILSILFALIGTWFMYAVLRLNQIDLSAY